MVGKEVLLSIVSRTSALVLASCLGCLITGCDAPVGTASPGTLHADLGITLPSIEDDDVTLVSTTDHDVHVLMFWATRCPCFPELTELQQIYDRLRDRGLNIYAISVDGPGSMARVPGIVAQERWTFPVLYDTDTRILARYNPKGDIPFWVILDAEGNVLQSHQGYMKGDFDAFEDFILDELGR
jgi:peroxiredoxin